MTYGIRSLLDMIDELDFSKVNTSESIVSFQIMMMISVTFIILLIHIVSIVNAAPLDSVKREGN